jgi:hypothetical protein
MWRRYNFEVIAREPLGPKHVALLRWIGDGCPDGVWPDNSHKNFMRMLQMRGLAMRRTGPGWQAIILLAGQYYLDRGTYPDPEPSKKPSAAVSRPPEPKRRRTASQAFEGALESTVSLREAKTSNADAAAVNPGPTLAASGALVLSQIRRPHPAIRELLEHPKRVDLPAEVRRRVHLISHSLVQEALRRGWKVTAVTNQMRDRYPSGRERWWPSNDLFRIDAGEQALGVQFRVKTTRIKHVATADEARRRARGQYVYAPSYDYQPTDILRLFLYHDTRKRASWEDTARRPIESCLAEILDSIEGSTRSVVARREADRRRWEEDQRRREEEQRQRKRVTHYDTWLDVLLGLQRRSREHTELATFVSELARLNASVDVENETETLALASFVAWAQTHLAASDPLAHLSLPGGEPPDMTHADWSQWKSHLEQERRGNLPWHQR